MRLLSTVWFWLVFSLTAPIVFAVGVLLFVLGTPFDRQRRAIHVLLALSGFNYLRVNPAWHARVFGREKLPRGPAVIVVNHQSMADVAAVLGIRHPFKFVSKASLFKLPIVGWLMSMAKYVAIERGRHASTSKMMDDCRKWLRDGMSVCIFPEGTYGPPGKLLPFKRGAFQLAVTEKVPLVPIVIRGTRETVIEDGPWMSPTSNITVTVMDPLVPSEFGDDEALSARVRQLYLRELQLTDSPQPAAKA